MMEQVLEDDLNNMAHHEELNQLLINVQQKLRGRLPEIRLKR